MAGPNAADIVDIFVKQAVENGIDIFRIFDALNDPRNVEASVNAVKKYGAHAQLAICYTISDVHTVAYYTQLAQQFVEMGVDSICIKDMAGILTPKVARELVSEIKKVIDVPLNIHTHSTSGIAQMTYLAAVEAGADMIDCAISPFAEGTSQPATEAIALALDEIGYRSHLDIEKLEEIANYFKGIRDNYLASGELDAKMMFTDPKALIYQVPGGMLSNLYSQLKKAKAVGRYDEVLREVPNVRADLGFPPLVTPMSQMVGTQAVFNVLSGERYKMVPNEIKDYLRGKYGKTPVPVTDAFRESLIPGEAVMTDRPANHLEPEFDRLKNELGDLGKTTEDVLTYALFPEVGKAYLERKYQTDQPIRIQARYRRE
ncbi:pyruvate carboxylase subunit B [Jeotgalibaca porci]|uniref:pyruvate carboxylase subunit B n=1 Tax=Jeotgalibaca porci TaxID=1868793 RepID=UPI00359F97DA